MSKISISNLCPTGSELFTDSESFLGELVANDLNTIVGGLGISIPISRSICICTIATFSRPPFI